jgi:outer membrane lipopolysaccharide assembly protein LptE/RlpB
MKKKIFTFLLFLFLSSCGYEAIYSLKNRPTYAFQISKLELSGDRQVNLKMKQILSIYSNSNIAIENGKIFELKISSNSEKITTTKNASGDATKFKNEITLKVQVSMDRTIISNFSVTEKFIYNNNSNTSELRSYENQIKNNLTEAAVDKVTSKLAFIK